MRLTNNITLEEFTEFFSNGETADGKNSLYFIDFKDLEVKIHYTKSKGFILSYKNTIQRVEIQKRIKIIFLSKECPKLFKKIKEFVSDVERDHKSLHALALFDEI